MGSGWETLQLLPQIPLIISVYLIIDFGNQKVAHLLITCDGVKPKQRERKYLRLKIKNDFE